MHCFLHQGPVLLLSPWAIMRHSLATMTCLLALIFFQFYSDGGIHLWVLNCADQALSSLTEPRFHISSRIVVRGFLYKSLWLCHRTLLPFHSHFTPSTFPRRWVKGKNFSGIQRMRDVQKYQDPWACPPYSAQWEMVIVHSWSCFMIGSKCL